jgi:hypothetical protein
MIQQNEIITFLIAIVAWIFIIIYYQKLKTLPSLNILLSSLLLLTAGWILTILEGFFWKESLNLFEHISYSVSAVVITLWCWIISKKKEVRS